MHLYNLIIVVVWTHYYHHCSNKWHLNAQMTQIFMHTVAFSEPLSYLTLLHLSYGKYLKKFLQSSPWLQWMVLGWGRSDWVSCVMGLTRKAKRNLWLIDVEAIWNQRGGHHLKSRAAAFWLLLSKSLMRRRLARVCWESRAPGLPLADSLHTMKYGH